MKQLLKKHARWFAQRISRDRLDSISAHGAFFIITSFIPFLAFVLTLMQQIHFPNGLSVIEASLHIFPTSVADYLLDLFPDALSSGVMPVAIIAAVWSSSMGMVAMIKGLDQIYDSKKPRGFLRLRLLAIVCVLVFAVVLIVTALLLVFGSTIYDFLLSKTSPFFATLLINFKSLAGFILLLIYFTLMYCLVPRRRVRFLHNLTGAAFSAGGWVLFSYVFSLFVETIFNFSLYGGLATLVIFMFWLFFCMYIMFLGAELAMWLEVSGIRDDLRLCFRKEKNTPPQGPPEEPDHPACTEQTKEE